MYFVSENYTFTEAVLMLLTEPTIIGAGILVFMAATLLLTCFFSAYYAHNESNLSLFKIWTIIPVLGVISGLLTSLIFALVTTYFVDLDKGYYEATGTIEKIEHQYAGQTDSNFTISLKLDNGDLVDIQMPLQSPESVEQGDAFTLQSETLFSPHEVKDFAPIEKLHYLPDHQSLGSDQSLILRFTVDFIVDGDVVKGHSD